MSIFVMTKRWKSLGGANKILQTLFLFCQQGRFFQRRESWQSCSVTAIYYDKKKACLRARPLVKITARRKVDDFFFFPAVLFSKRVMLRTSAQGVPLPQPGD